MEECKYSIIIPVYNLSSYIEHTLKSVCAMGLKDSELIIVDDGSKDDSLDIVNQYVLMNDVRCRILTQENSGVSKARNVGIDAANGEYIIFMDGDDLCDISMLGTISRNCKNNPDMLVWRFNLVDGDKKDISQETFLKENYSGAEFIETLLKGKARIRIGSFAIKRSLVMDKKLRFTEGCSFCEDVEFMYKAVLACEEIQAVNDVLYDYIKREGSAINTYDMRKFQAPMAVQRVYEYSVGECTQELSEFVKDSLKNGLLITHTMFSFDSCCKYISGMKQYGEFIEKYFCNYSSVEAEVNRAFDEIVYIPKVFSKKRIYLFKANRKLYGLYRVVCHKVGKN